MKKKLFFPFFLSDAHQNVKKIIALLVLEILEILAVCVFAQLGILK
jgi:hypothetical protein